MENGYEELPITAAHAVAALPRRHRDKFDRILVAQAHADGILLLTADPLVMQYQA